MEDPCPPGAFRLGWGLPQRLHLFLAREQGPCCHLLCLLTHEPVLSTYCVLLRYCAPRIACEQDWALVRGDHL